MPPLLLKPGNTHCPGLQARGRSALCTCASRNGRDHYEYVHGLALEAISVGAAVVSDVFCVLADDGYVQLRVQNSNYSSTSSPNERV